MAKNYVQPGNVMDAVVDSATDSGEVVVVGDVVGVAIADIAADTAGPVQVSGVFELPKASSEAISQGASVFWTGSAITATAGSNTAAGICWKSAESADALVQVKLNERATVTITVEAPAGP